MFLFSCEDDKIEPSSEASLTSLTLTVGSTDYEVTFTGTQHTLRVGPYGTEIPATVGVKDIVLSSGATSDAGTELSVTDNAVTITVTAADGTTRKKYTVTLGFTTAGITSFTFEVPGNESMALDTADHKRIVGKIDQEAKTITFDRQSAYVYLDKLKATFEVSEAGAKVQVADADQTSGTTEQDFSAPVSYEVSAEGTETTTYRVTLTKSVMATIPDDSFRAKLKTLFPAAFTEDQLDITHNDVVNKDGELGVKEQTPKLTSVKGIEFFRALNTLDCRKNGLTSLDMSKNTALTLLACSDNGLTSLNLRKNTTLRELYCGGNNLQSLDVSANTALTKLQCRENSLTSLDVRENTALTELYCYSNSLTSLDVTENTALTNLICSNNSLTSLDISANTALTQLGCGESNLSSLNVSANTALTSLDCSSNSLTSLDVRENTALTSLVCDNNSLTSLDVSVNTALTSLVCDNNSLTSLDVSVNTALTILKCDNNSLTSLDVSAHTALTTLVCGKNRLTSLDMTGMRSVADAAALNLGTGTGTDLEPDNHLLETLRVNAAVQDNQGIRTIKRNRGVGLTITTVNNDGKVACNDYAPATDGGNCNAN